jgi:hypothetical protein
MFNPSRDEVRKFFLETWAKHRASRPLVGLETTAVDVLSIHPEYHALLGEGETALFREFAVEDGNVNPFLHLSLHLAIEEQLGIDQPKGLADEFSRIAGRLGDRHAALHVVLECLGETIWTAQRNNAPPDADAYLACVRRHT